MSHFPPEIMDIIIGFAADGTSSLGDSYIQWLQMREISLLSTLSLVSRNWLSACRRVLFKRLDFVFDVKDSRRISDFIDILRGRDHLPRIPHILSLLSTITLKLPIACVGSIANYPELMFTFLDELAKRKEFFRPKTLNIQDNLWKLPHHSCICHPSLLVWAIVEAFSTITHLNFDAPIEPDCCSNLDHLMFFFNELRELDIWYYWPALSLTNGGGLHGYRIPESLRTLQFNTPLYFPGDHLDRTLDWLKLHPPLRQMRRLSFVNAAPSSHAVIQALADICPDLDALFLSYGDGDIIRKAAGSSGKVELQITWSPTVMAVASGRKTVVRLYERPLRVRDLTYFAQSEQAKREQADAARFGTSLDHIENRKERKYSEVRWYHTTQTLWYAESGQYYAAGSRQRHRQSLHATPPPTNRFSLVKRPSSLIRYSTLSFTTLHSQVLIPGLMVRKRSLLSASMMFSNPTPHLPPYQRRVLQF
uniref:Uncharacterized protein n=1 Tax=Moniliophthora roreri TaxID=221103 RepID=A0A0W0F4D3_MONRR